jgi:hypothetical protein
VAIAANAIQKANGNQNRAVTEFGADPKALKLVIEVAGPTKNYNKVNNALNGLNKVATKIRHKKKRVTKKRVVTSAKKKRVTKKRPAKTDSGKDGGKKIPPTGPEAAAPKPGPVAEEGPVRYEGCGPCRRAVPDVPLSDAGRSSRDLLFLLFLLDLPARLGCSLAPWCGAWSPC